MPTGVKLRMELFFLLAIVINSLICVTKGAEDDPFNFEDNFHYSDGKFEEDSHLVLIRSKTREKRSSDFSLVENPGELDVTLEKNNRSLHFHLQPNNELLSPGYKLVIRSANGTVEEELHGPKIASCLYIGSQKGKPEYSAAFSNCDGDGFTGVFVDDEGTHLVRPFDTNDVIKRRKRSSNDVTPDGLHIVRTRRDKSKCALRDMRTMTAPGVARPLTSEEMKEAEKKFFARYSSSIHKEAEIVSGIPVDEPELDAEFIAVGSEKQRWKRDIYDRYKIETAVFVDDEMYSSFRKRWGSKGLVASIEDYVLTIMNAVYLLYKAPSLKTDVSIVLTRLEIFKEPDKDLRKSDGRIMSYLSNFCGWQARLKKKLVKAGRDSEWDHGILLTGLDLWDLNPDDTDVIGLAWVAGMCRSHFSCTINEGTTFEAVYVITHEMGHNLNMSHDGTEEFGNFCDKNKHIMSPSTGPGKVTWSGCSNVELESFLDTHRSSLSCLRNEAAKERRSKLLPDEKLPGEIYDADEQCQLALASDKAKPYTTSNRPYNNICNILWCKLGNLASQAHPALEGTSCERGQGRCTSGECLRDIRTGINPSRDDENEIPEEGRNSRGGRKNTFKNLFVNIKDFFKRYLFLRRGEPSQSMTQLSTVTHWTLHNMGECSVSCGGGWQKGQVICVATKTNDFVDDMHCDAQLKPPARTSCNTLPCFL